MNPPFGRIGGKKLIANKLINAFPPLEKFKYYVEPFVGAGNIFFKKPYIDGQIEVINDLDKDVYKILKALKTRSTYIDNNFNRNIDKKYFDSIKNKNDVLSILEKIVTSFFAKGKSFNNVSNGSDTHKIKKNFKQYGPRLKKTIILNKSFEEIIKIYDSNETFFYLDPPYESLKQTDYKDYVTPEDVFKAVKNIKGFFMLSYNDSPKIRKLFKCFNIKTIKTKYSGTHNIEIREKKELVITNYNH